jgi:hypothetical protein
MGAPRAHFGFSSATAQAFGDHDLRSWRLELTGQSFETVFVSPVSDFSVMVRDPAGGLIRRLKDGTQRAGAPFASADVAPPAPRSLTNSSTPTATRSPRSTATATPRLIPDPEIDHA